MIVALLITAVLAILLGIRSHRRLDARLDAISHGLIRIEKAIGSEDWIELLENVGNWRSDDTQLNGIVGRLERIEIAVDPMARAKDEVKRLLRVLDEELQEDPGSAYEHNQVNKIAAQLERGERPERADWDQWIRTPFPLA